MSAPLKGLRIWVTRPRKQSLKLLPLLTLAGAEVVALPLIEIAPPLDPAPLDEVLSRLDGFDLAVFVSPSALDSVMEQLSADWPAGLPVAVMGPGSAARARALGFARIIAPSRQFDSAGLLQEPEMQALAGKRVIIFRGDGGNEAFPATLIERGAELTLVSAYRRLPPALDEASLRAQLAAGCDGLIVSSSEAVQYLFNLAGDATRQQLQSVLYFAPHPRIVAALAAQGSTRSVLTAVGDAGIAETIINHFGQRPPAAQREENA